MARGATAAGLVVAAALVGGAAAAGPTAPNPLLPVSAALPGGPTAEQTLELEFSRRGIHREDGFQFSTAFPFGLLERRAQVALRREILVYPCMNPQPGLEELMFALSGEVAAHYRGSG